MCLVQAHLFPVINEWRMAAGYPSLFLIIPFDSSSSSSSPWLIHSTAKPHLFYTDTMKETQRQRERIKFLVSPSLLFLMSRRGLSLSLSLLRSPPLSPSNLLPETRDTPTFTLSPFLSASWPAPLCYWMCDRPFHCISGNSSFCQGQGWWRRTHTHTHTHTQPQFNWFSVFPQCRCLFLMPFFVLFKKKSESWGEAVRGTNSIHPILSEKAEAF